MVGICISKHRDFTSCSFGILLSILWAEWNHIRLHKNGESSRLPMFENLLDWLIHINAPKDRKVCHHYFSGTLLLYFLLGGDIHLFQTSLPHVPYRCCRFLRPKESSGPHCVACCLWMTSFLGGPGAANRKKNIK